MGVQYHHLRQTERDRIKALRLEGHSLRTIATTLGCSHSTLSRELRRNSYRTGNRTTAARRGSYDPAHAQWRAAVRRNTAKYQGMKIEQDQALRSFVIQGLEEGWNPDEIAGHMKAAKCPFYASKTAIYNWLRSSRGQLYCQYLASMRYRARRRRPVATRRALIPERTSITERPAGAANRTRYGHWEGDCIVSGKKTGSTVALAVFIERRTRLLAARLIPDLKAESFTAAAASCLSGKKTRSLTLDNGIENRDHGNITTVTGARVFFCDPYSSWQKGSVEQANKLIRQYIPKGSDLGNYDQAYVETVIDRLNRKPRRCLGYQSALELAATKGVIPVP